MKHALTHSVFYANEEVRKKMWTIFLIHLLRRCGFITFWRSTVRRGVCFSGVRKRSICQWISVTFSNKQNRSIVNIINITDRPRYWWENMINISIERVWRWIYHRIMPVSGDNVKVYILFHFAVKCTVRSLVCMLKYRREICSEAWSLTATSEVRKSSP